MITANYYSRRHGRDFEVEITSFAGIAEGSVDVQSTGGETPFCTWEDGILVDWWYAPVAVDRLTKIRNTETGREWATWEQVVCKHVPYEQGIGHYEGHEYLSHGVREDNIRWVVRCPKCAAELEEPEPKRAEADEDSIPF